MGEHRRRVEFPARRHDHQRDGPLVPFRVGLGHHRGLGDVGQGDDVVFQVNRGDPLAAGFDQVLGTVGDQQILVRVDLGDIAGDEPAIVELVRLRIVVVLRGDPRPADAKLAHGLAVVGQGVPVLVEDFHFQPRHQQPGLGDVLELLVFAQAQVGMLAHLARQGAERVRLGHAPALDHLDLVVVPIPAHQ